MKTYRAFYRKALAGCIAFSCVPLFAADAPQWWTHSTFGFWNGVAAEDYAPLNAGQIKNVATRARLYMEAMYGPIDWDWAYEGSGAANPFPFSAGGDFAPANIGQLKMVAYGFYKVLHHYGHAAQKNIEDYNGNTGAIDGFTVPWVHPSGDNNTIANIGQLKMIFSFWPDKDTINGGNGLPDYWEWLYLGSYSGGPGAGPGDDPDDDGLINTQEWHLGSNPDLNESQIPAQRRNYAYDALGRLTAVSGLQTASYGYDEEGNLETSN